ncbi:flippase-like domain-containing protein [bacterium]|nr:flippase-like domain-containing protein [bacterium]
MNVQRKSSSAVTSLSSEVEQSDRSSFFRRLIASRKFHSALGISVSVLLLFWVFSEIDIAAVQEPLLEAHYWVLLPALAVFLLHFVLRACRWQYLLPNGEHTTLRHRFDAVMVGNFANFVLPLRAGEFVRPYLLSKLSPISFAEGFASIIIERFFDLTAAIVTFALLLPYLPTTPDWVSTSAWALGVVASLILLFILSVVFAPRQILALFDLCFARSERPLIGKARGFVEDFVASARVLAEPKRLILVTVLTALVWGSNYLLFTVFLYLLDLEQSGLLGTTLAVIIALAVAAPSAPGFIGVYQTACLAGFALFQMSEENAFVYSVITHIFQYILFIGLGFFALSRAGLHLGELRKRSQRSVEEMA